MMSSADAVVMAIDSTTEPKLPTNMKSSGLWSRRRGKAALSMDLPCLEKKTSSLSLLSDRYKVLDKIGSGSAGVVHRAIHLESGRKVAIKTPRSDDPGAADAAKREYALLQRLGTHHSIIEVLDFHNLQGEAALVLEFFEGSTLQAAVKEKRMTETTSRTLCIALFKAVEHLHTNNILHRDVKPQNVLVSGCLSKLRLIDFNAAACLDDGVPLTPTGTNLYKAPEVLLGEVACAASDVWASGLCVFFMLSGSLPQGRDALDPHVSIKEDVALQPESFNALCWQHVSEECRSMLQVCLAINPEERPAVSDLLDDAWISDPLLRRLSMLSCIIPGAGAYISAFSYLSNTETAR